MNYSKITMEQGEPYKMFMKQCDHGENTHET